jgi:hypothetical protein
MALGPNRIWFSSRVALLPANPGVLSAYARRARSEAAPLLVIHRPDQMALATHRETLAQTAAPQAGPALDALPPCQPAALANLVYRPNELAFRFVAPAGGWLLVTDRWAPGWRLTVNGRPAPLYGANFAFRAVPVGTGTSDIRFTYDPASFSLLVALSWTTLAAIAFFSLLPALKPLHRAHGDPRHVGDQQHPQQQNQVEG